jgi:uncharacterized surface protein with fasciclin (FAS1) repeats
MKKYLLLVGAVLALNITTSRVFAQTQTDTTKKTTTTTTTTTAPATTTPATDAASDVVGALASNADYSTALAAVKAAGLDSTLKTGGPYTIFAPNNAAFTSLGAKGDSLMKDPVKLASLLKGHVVKGKYAKADIIKALNAGKGKASVTTIDGQTLQLSITAGKLQLTNAAGSSAQVTLYDLIGANGIVNGLNGVLTPTK